MSVEEAQAALESRRLANRRPEDNEWNEPTPWEPNISAGYHGARLETFAPDRQRADTYCAADTEPLLRLDSLQRMGYTNVTSMQVDGEHGRKRAPQSRIT